MRNRNARRAWFDRAAKQTGVTGLTPHELRHTAASLAVKAGANVKALQRMLGHASAAIPSLGDGRASVRRLRDPLRVPRGHQQREVLRGTGWDKWMYRSIGPFLSLLLVAGLFNPGRGGYGLRVFVAVLILLALASTWRGWRLGTIQIDAQGIEAYGALRRWRWAWSELDYVEVGSGPLPFAPATRNEPLVVHSRDGRVTRLSSINGRSRTLGRPSCVALAVDKINARIQSEGTAH